jgi:mono/diheme cytochrome c family protein
MESIMKVDNSNVFPSEGQKKQYHSTTQVRWADNEHLSLSVGIAMIVLLLLLLMPSRGHGQEQEVAAGGKIVFEDNCMVCHGRGGKGDGIMATFNLLQVSPPDLTLLAKRNGGKFPFWHVYGVIDGRDPLKAHGSREMPLWGDEFRLDAGTGTMAQAEVRGKILSLVYYLQSLQEK